jgi:hypothetical protein
MAFGPVRLPPLAQKEKKEEEDEEELKLGFGLWGG